MYALNRLTCRSGSVEGIAMDANFWSDLMLPGVSVLEKILRPVMVYVFLILAFRLAGKRELAQLNPFDLVVLLTISNTVQNAIIGNDNSLLGGLLGAATLLLANWLVVRWTFKHPRIERFVEGTPTLLVDGGVVRPEALEKELVTIEELGAAARRQGLPSLDEADRVVLETSGTLTFVQKAETTEVRRHEELLARLDAIQKQVAALRSVLDGRAAEGA
jgi:uncharacterized membrane protein YcaP (DUF421 family)